MRDLKAKWTSLLLIDVFLIICDTNWIQLPSTECHKRISGGYNETKVSLHYGGAQVTFIHHTFFNVCFHKIKRLRTWISPLFYLEYANLKSSGIHFRQIKNLRHPFPPDKKLAELNSATLKSRVRHFKISRPPDLKLAEFNYATFLSCINKLL